MRAFFKAIDEEVCLLAVNGYTEPTMAVDGVEIPKPTSKFYTAPTML